MDRECIQIAVNYWGDFFTNPTYSDKNNGGLEGFASILATFTKMSVNERTTLRADQVDGFKKDLIEYLEENLSEGKTVTLSTDWSPEYPLSDFLRNNDLPETYFPSKTTMFVEANKVKVRNLEEEKLLHPN